MSLAAIAWADIVIAVPLCVFLKRHETVFKRSVPDSLFDSFSFMIYDGDQQDSIRHPYADPVQHQWERLDKVIILVASLCV